jgi:hypothetical protein
MWIVVSIKLLSSLVCVQVFVIIESRINVADVSFAYRMDLHGPDEFYNPPPTLPPGVAVCDGIPRAKWNTRCVTLRNEGGQDVAHGVCQNVDPELVIDMDGKPLGDDRVAVQIAESLCEEDVPSVWMWSMHSWDIKRVFLNGVSLYDHDQTHIYNTAMNASNQRVRKGVRSYESSRERIESGVPPKKESLLTIEAITQVSTQTCCERNCLQPFPRGQIQAIRAQLHVHDGVYARKKCLLEVHRQIHKDSAGKKFITLKGREVCPQAWWTIHGIGKATFYRYKELAKAGKQAEGHGNLGSKKPRTHTLQAVATLRTLIVSNADKMPHKTRTLESGEKVPAMVLPSSFRWSDQLPIINEANGMQNLQPISSSGLSNIRRASFPEFAPKARGDTFARCGLCDTYKQLRSACTPLSDSQNKWSNILNTHIVGQRAHRELYYGNRYISDKYPEKMLCIIHDKMDHSKTASPHFSHKTKATDSFFKMPVAVTGMIAHGHGDVRYAHYGLGIFPTDSNHTIGSIAKLLRDLEGPPKNSSRKLFSIGRDQSTLTKALLNGSETCLDSLIPPPPVPLEPNPLPPILTLQLDNASGDNKNRWVFAYCSMLIYKGVFREVYINFLIVGHTHEDIDALFGRWSSMLKTNNYPTLPRLMKSFMECETVPVIPHFIEEVPDFKTFVHGYLGTGGDVLGGHSKSQQFKFFMDSNGWPLMEYKNLCTDKNWLPEHGKGIRLWSETEDGLPKVPSGSPPPLAPQQMKSLEEVKKGLNGFIAHWNKMANDDLSGEFRRKNGPISDYWKDVRIALDAPLQVRETILDGFWPASRITNDDADRRQSDGTICEGDAEDAPFVGRKRDRPRASFRVNRDTFAGYFVVVRPADGDPKPFWLARAITNPNPDPGHMHMIQIQYWTPASNLHINMETYDGWDTKKGNVWREDRVISPTWSSTNCIMTAWKPRFREGTSDPKVAISKPQIDIIKASVTAFMFELNNDGSTAQE